MYVLIKSILSTSYANDHLHCYPYFLYSRCSIWMFHYPLTTIHIQMTCAKMLWPENYSLHCLHTVMDGQPVRGVLRLSPPDSWDRLQPPETLRENGWMVYMLIFLVLGHRNEFVIIRNNMFYVLEFPVSVL